MALTGLDIYKMLPKTNCGKCGVPTCLAFAMSLASKKASLDKCPDVSAEAKNKLDSASMPPIQLVTIGTGDNKVEIGNETVLFRHEQTFYHPTGLAVEIADSLSASDITAKVKSVNALEFDRVGKKVKFELIAVTDKSNNPDKFAEAAKTVAANSKLAIILVSTNPAVMEAGVKLCEDRRPLLYGANAENYQAMAELARKYKCPLGVSGKNLDDLAELTTKITALGIKELVINPGSTELPKLLSDITQIRRLALKKTFRPLGFPIILFAPAVDTYQSVLFAGTFIAKYAGIVVMPEASLWQGLALVSLRQNIYTDPQKPIQVESKIYPVGNVTDQSPVLVTTNFSLTYFTVQPEIEASKVPTYIVVVNTEGMSVLTAFAADKFNEKIIAKAIADYKVSEVVKHKKLIIPGYVAVLSGKLEAESGWQVMVGPREASAIPSYLKNVWK
ncbi:MAG: acetyl-CoA decarbonylase/synthase complex subunit gamma [Planctomycetes bacterium]|nr:acetyl-CoA decarbonylase/synthase complex subunit gamma [Planctomycetota bacterium]